MVDVFRQVRRVLAPHGTCWVNLGDSYANDTKWGGSTGGKHVSALHGAAGGLGRDKRETGLKAKDLVGIPWRVALALQEPYYTGHIKDERDRIWLAAMVEAEGCMFIHKRKAGQSNGQGYERKNDSYGAGMEVASTDRVIVERCLAIAGKGSICEQTPSQNARRKQTIYRWTLRSNECRDIVRELYPHMVAKQHEARILLACPSSGPDATKAWESLKAIHQGEPPTIDFPAPASLFEPGWYLRSDVIWSKANPMPESVTDRPTKAHEYVFLLTKRPRYFFDQEAVREPHSPDGRAVTGRTSANGTHENHRLDDGERRERWPNGGRNVRTVWEIATQPYPEAHFATFPEELPRRCIKAGCPEQVCRTCGKPRERIVGDVPADPDLTQRTTSHYDTRERYGAGNGGNGGFDRLAARMRDGVRKGAIGWSDCGHDDYRPGRVLDPFMGSGTTAYVARQLGRSSVGIELNPEYAALCARRLQQQSLFAEST